MPKRPPAETSFQQAFPPAETAAPAEFTPPTHGGSYVVSEAGELERVAFTKGKDEVEAPEAPEAADVVDGGAPPAADAGEAPGASAEDPSSNGAGS